MGLFSSLKDVKDIVTAAPGIIGSAQQMNAQVAQLGPQGMVNAMNAAAHGEPSAAALEPVAGVDLAAYAKVVKGISAYGYDAARLPEVAVANGIAPSDWEQAQAVWGERIQHDRALGSRFNQLYTTAG